MPRESIVTSFLWLAREGLEREPSHVWNSLAAESADIEAVPLFPELLRRLTPTSKSSSPPCDKILQRT